MGRGVPREMCKAQCTNTTVTRADLKVSTLGPLGVVQFSAANKRPLGESVMSSNCDRAERLLVITTQIGHKFESR